MTHDEYVAGLERFGDAPEQVRGVLEHVARCAVCAREQRDIARRLVLEDSRRSAAEEIVRWAAVAATIAILAVGMRGTPAKQAETNPSYRIVGNASGVVAYTPDGIVTGTASTLPRADIR